MLTQRVIPCLDIRNGRVVKGVRFANLRDAGDPVAQASRYEQAGADELVLLDVSATPEGRGAALEVVQMVRRAIGIPLCVGGGVRRIEDALALLAAGADKVGVNTAAVENPELLSELSRRVGSQCVVLAIDAASRVDGDGWEVVVHSGRTRTGIDAPRWASDATKRGVGEILLTSWDRDGTRAGYDLALIRATRARTQVPIIASGGACTPEHMCEGFEAGADAVLAASIFHENEFTPDDLKGVLKTRGIEVRP